LFFSPVVPQPLFWDWHFEGRKACEPDFEDKRRHLCSYLGTPATKNNIKQDWLRSDFRDWCLIHNAHLGKIPSFCKILHPKITHLKKFFYKYFCLLSAIVIQAWHSKVKTITLLHKIVCTYFKWENSRNLRQKRKWALWMRHQRCTYLNDQFDSSVL
jgi:hypothetical protein